MRVSVCFLTQATIPSPPPPHAKSMTVSYVLYHQMKRDGYQIVYWVNERFSVLGWSTQWPIAHQTRNVQKCPSYGTGDGTCQIGRCFHSRFLAWPCAHGRSRWWWRVEEREREREGEREGNFYFHALIVHLLLVLCDQHWGWMHLLVRDGFPMYRISYISFFLFPSSPSPPRFMRCFWINRSDHGGIWFYRARVECDSADKPIQTCALAWHDMAWQ